MAAMFLVAALLRPAILHPLNRLWLKFGLLLHRVVNPVIMALLFFGTVLPTGLVMRALGKDLLRLKRQPDADSYWIPRAPPGPCARDDERPILGMREETAKATVLASQRLAQRRPTTSNPLAAYRRDFFVASLHARTLRVSRGSRQGNSDGFPG